MPIPVGSLTPNPKQPIQRGRHQRPAAPKAEYFQLQRSWPRTQTILHDGWNGGKHVDDLQIDQIALIGATFSRKRPGQLSQRRIEPWGPAD